jgi:predicted DNA-binding transcriptional regulator AlpA
MRYVSRRELADFLSLRDISGVIHQPGFPTAVRLNARVCRWSLEEVLAWLDGRKAQSAVAPTSTPRRRARRRPI